MGRWCLMFLACAGAGCNRDQVAPSPAPQPCLTPTPLHPSPALRAVGKSPDLAAHAARNFARARFYKPASGDASLIGYQLAPLIVDETQPESGKDCSTKIAAPQAGNLAPEKRPTVYFDLDTIEANGQKLDRVSYFWRYPRRDDCASEASPWRGVRIVVGVDGMPLVWEAIGSDEGTRVFYASRSLEQAARAQFGDPLRGRDFSIEKSPADPPTVRVVRIIDDGPIPMGPYVYIDASEKRLLAAIHCRCQPSQFDEVVETVEYELQPIELLWPDERGKLEAALQGPSRPDPLEKLLRWPKI